MKVLLSLLKPFVDLSDLSPQTLCERMTLSGFEVSSCIPLGSALDQIVVGRILTVAPHPNADRLSLTEVETSTAKLRIVCGAKNIAPGDLVPVALPGAVLPGGLHIKVSIIRGQESQGMLCSGRELGLSEDHSGIFHFAPETPLSRPITDLLPAADHLLEFEITPNRGDCLSHFGLARQIAAVLKRPLSVPPVTLTETAPEAHSVARCEIEPNSGCGRYSARILQGVKIGPSPTWLVQALEKLGQRSINNVVDITNLVMLEIGHPLHAFDLDTLHGSSIQVRRARVQESVLTLDGEQRTLSPDDLVIADQDRAVALAGIMGGKETEVSERTRNILLEAAWFEPRQIRRTSHRLHLYTEASYRFERSTDPEIGLTLALDRAAQLILQTAGGELRQGIVDVYPEIHSPKRLVLDLQRAERVLGLSLDPMEAATALSRLGFLVEPEPSAGRLQVTVPRFRTDVSQDVDLFEELAEALGYDQIPATLPIAPLASPPPHPRRSALRRLREGCAGAGLSETIAYSFMGPVHLDRLGLPADHDWRRAVAIANPLREESSLMRTALLPGLLDTLAYNHHRGQTRAQFFECGAVFHPQSGQDLPAEPWHLGMVLAGKRDPLHWQVGKKGADVDFHHLKGIVENVLTRFWHPAAMSEPPVQWEFGDFPFLHPQFAFRILSGQTVLGWAGRLHPEAQEAYKLKFPVWAAELDAEAVLSLHFPSAENPAISRFPFSERDIALAVAEAVPAGDVARCIRESAGPMLVSLAPFDLYRGEGLPAGMKSIAFSLRFQAQDRTLQEEELKMLLDQVLARVQDRFGAQQR